MRVVIFSAIITFCAFSLNALSLSAADGTAGTNTLWHWLGIPQGYQKVKDASVNKKGNRPQKERKPALKRITDPENLQSDNPAIKNAAKIKAAEDLAPQKIKALKYLATVGCGCYPGIKEAFLDALNDCTEEVRYEAAMAICQSSGDPCTHCDKSCCSAELMNKLNELAYGQDAKGCNIEPSARVRAAAKTALDACRRKHPAGPVMLPKETPREEPLPTPAKKKESPFPPEGPGAVPTEVPKEPQAPIPAPPGTPVPSSAKGGPAEAGAPINFAGFSRGEGDAGIVMVTDAEVKRPEKELVALRPGASQQCLPQTPTCPPYAKPGVPPGPPTVPAPHPEVAPEVKPPAELPGIKPGEAPTAERAETPAPSALASTYGALSGPQSVAPYMIGDQFGGGGGASTIVRSFTFTNLTGDPPSPDSYFLTYNSQGMLVANNHVASNPIPPYTSIYTFLDYNDAAGRLGNPPLPDVPAGGTLIDGTTDETGGEVVRYTNQFRVQYTLDIPSPSGGGVVGRNKIAENTSPIPRDRILFDYSYFNGVPMYPGGVNVNRFTPGFEKTFFNRWMSLEMKIPMATTLDSTISADGTTGTSHAEFGNMAITWKSLVMLRRNFALSGGLMTVVPTADNIQVVTSDGTPLVQVLNRSTHLAPFAGFLWTPNERFFAQGFFQWDAAANGNPVLINDFQRQGLQNVGLLTDTMYQYVDLGVGYWVYRGHERYHRLTGLAWTAELHWNQSLQDADVISSGYWRVGDYASNVENFNLTLGAHFEFNDLTTITAAYAVPLGGGMDREFNGEFRIMFNRRFGPQNRLTRTPSTF